MTDALKLYAESKMHSRRWIEIIDPPETDDRAAEEVAAGILQDLGLHIV